LEGDEKREPRRDSARERCKTQHSRYVDSSQLNPQWNLPMSSTYSSFKNSALTGFGFTAFRESNDYMNKSHRKTHRSSQPTEILQDRLGQSSTKMMTLLEKQANHILPEKIKTMQAQRNKVLRKSGQRFANAVQSYDKRESGCAVLDAHASSRSSEGSGRMNSSLISRHQGQYYSMISAHGANPHQIKYLQHERARLYGRKKMQSSLEAKLSKAPKTHQRGLRAAANLEELAQNYSSRAQNDDLIMIHDLAS